MLYTIRDANATTRTRLISFKGKVIAMAQIQYKIESLHSTIEGEVYIPAGKCIASIVAGIADTITNRLWIKTWIIGIVDGEHMPAFFISNQLHSKGRLN